MTKDNLRRNEMLAVVFMMRFWSGTKEEDDCG